MTGRSVGSCAWRSLPSAFAAGGAGRLRCQAIYAANVRLIMPCVSLPQYRRTRMTAPSRHHAGKNAAWMADRGIDNGLCMCT